MLNPHHRGSQIPECGQILIVEAELRHGVAQLPAGKRRKALNTAIESLLDEDFRDRILPFDRTAARAYAAIAADRRAAGLPISQFDCQIAATARTHEATMATRSLADYQDCGVELINPWTFSLGT
ncbi:MAG: type II toxin-antitoxin system VapC family toxin [Betaproteobacteria bacterium]|nr:type II toxin-antitoxin system VapC family toxin [Betaproteobacteria bacterium]